MVAASSALLFGLGWGLLYNVQGHLDTRDCFLYKAYPTDDGWQVSPPAASLVLQLRHRADRARVQATSFFVLLIVVFFCAVLIYTAAPSIAHGVRVGDAKTEQDKAQLTPSQPPATEDASDAARSETENALLATTRELRAVVQEVRLQSESQLKLDFYAVLSTRVGAILMLVFLAQFLINAYRYTMRLAAAFDSRADALMLGWNDAQEAKKFMSVDEHTFEKVKSPSQEALEIAKTLVGKKLV